MADSTKARTLQEKWDRIAKWLGGMLDDHGCIVVRHDGTKLYLAKTDRTVILKTVREEGRILLDQPIRRTGLISIDLINEGHVMLLFEPVIGFRTRVDVFANASYEILSPRPYAN